MPIILDNAAHGSGGIILESSLFDAGASPSITNVNTDNVINNNESIVYNGTNFAASGNICQVIQGATTINLTETAQGTTQVTCDGFDIHSTAAGFGSAVARLNDGSENADRAVTLLPEAGRDYVVVASAITDNTSLLFNFNGTPANGDIIEFPTTLNVNADGTFDSASDGVYACNYWDQLTWYSFNVTIVDGTVEDTTPDAFSFTDQTDVGLSSLIESNAITVSGISAAAAISVTGGEYAVNGGAYTSAAGTVDNGDTVTVRHTSSASFATAVNTQLTIGGVSDTFTSTTVAEDTTPDAFVFTDQNNVIRSTVFVSNAITVSGINSPVSISITGGEYSVNSGAYTASSGTVSLGDSITVRHTSSPSFSTSVNTTLTVGGVSDTFTTTTVAEDTTPDAFLFTDLTDVALSTEQVSNVITVSGINSIATVSIVGGEYSIDGGAYTSAPGNIVNGQQVTVRHTSSGSFSTVTNTTLTIGGVSDTFTTTTVAQDTVPDAFSFIDQTNVGLSTVVTSAPITVVGINSPAAISVINGEYSIDGGAFTTAVGTVSNGQQVRARHTSSDTFNDQVDTQVTIGGVSDTFMSTTLSGTVTAGIDFSSLGPLRNSNAHPTSPSVLLSNQTGMQIILINSSGTIVSNTSSNTTDGSGIINDVPTPGQGLAVTLDCVIKLSNGDGVLPFQVTVVDLSA